MGFDNYNGSTGLASGLKPMGDGDFALMESCDIMARADGTRLDKVLEDMQSAINPVSLEEELAEQALLIDQLKVALQRKIAGSGESAESRARLPRIRYANFTNVANDGEEPTAYRFTIENMGDGTLQVGDRLQICCKRSYPHGKVKLRKMLEYVIQEKDLNSRFLKIEVDRFDPIHRKWLYRNDRRGETHSTLSSLYFRLKRATSFDEDGKENNAIFSNVEQVWKTYDVTTFQLWIK